MGKSKKRSRERESSPELRRKIKRLEEQLRTKRASREKDASSDRDPSRVRDSSRNRHRSKSLEKEKSRRSDKDTPEPDKENQAKRQTENRPACNEVSTRAPPTGEALRSVLADKTNVSQNRQPDELPETTTETVVSQLPITEKAGAADPDEASASTQVSNPGTSEKILDEDTRRALGEDPTAQNKKEVSIHTDLMALWSNWLSVGLPKEMKEEVLDKYPRKGNLYLEAPELNPEIAVILNEAGLKRDSLFTQEQNWAGSAMSALGEAITMIIDDTEEPVDRLVLLQNLADTGKLIAQLHFQISTARKACIAPILSKQTKELLQKTKPTNLLYGDNIGEIIKTAKSMEKMGNELKQQPASASTTKSTAKTVAPSAPRPLNWRGSFPRRGNSYQGQRRGQYRPNFPRGRNTQIPTQNNFFNQSRGQSHRGGKQ